MQTFNIPLTIAWLLLVVCPLSVAAESIEVKRISFAAGTSSATVKGSITGDKIVDYKLGAKAGQKISVTFQTSSGSNYFNLMAPGETEVAFFNGSNEGNRYEGNLPKTGDYTVRVYLMRSAARRNEKANYTLTVGISGSAARAEHRGDAKVAGTPYHATGNVPCAMKPEQPTGSCHFGVTREGNGTGTVTVTRPDGHTRMIFFKQGKATGYDKSQADSGQFSAKQQGDLSIIRIGQERYEIPDAVIFGG